MNKMVFKVAIDPQEFEQIFRLNYATFAEEIPQHGANPERRLVDKFHAENTYLICMEDDHLIGMLAVRDKRPFSLDYKLENLDSYLPHYTSICEVRLLAIESGRRSTRAFGGLVLYLAQYCEARHYDLALISGTTRQAKLYKHLGFVAFGPLVGAGDTLFQPMYMTLDAFRKFKSTAKLFMESFKK